MPEYTDNTLIPFGKHVTGVMKRPNEVPSGLACNCLCTACNRPLLARQGQIRIWHFAHAADPSGSCSHPGETAVHAMAKQIICLAQAISLPPLFSYNPNGKPHRQVEPAKIIQLSNCQPEAPWHGFRPDVLADQLAIEIHVSHATENPKRAAFQSHQLSAIEIHLPANSELQPDFDTFVLHSAPRAWLFHSRQAELNQQAANELQQIEAQKQLAFQQARDHQRRLQELIDQQTTLRNQQTDLQRAHAWFDAKANDKQRALKNQQSAINQLANSLDTPPRPIPTAPNNRLCFHCNSPSAFFGFSLPRWNPPFFACRDHRNLAETHNLAFPPR